VSWFRGFIIPWLLFALVWTAGEILQHVLVWFQDTLLWDWSDLHDQKFWITEVILPGGLVLAFWLTINVVGDLFGGGKHIALRASNDASKVP
jgi:hypothetical protein